MRWEHTIERDPTPKPRPRFTRQGFAYTPAAYKKVENDIKTELKLFFDREPLKKWATLRLHFYFKPPKSYGGSDKHTKRPDIDNLQKSIMDAANGVLYRDDSIVCTILSTKRYSVSPRIKIVLRGE